jgi:carbamoyl-phosphate synthase large subunit
MKKLLLSGLGGSLFPYLDKALKNEFELFYLDSNSSLKNLYADLNFKAAPMVKDQSYESLVIDLIRKKGIDYYIPLIDEELTLAKAQIEKNAPVHVLAPERSFIDLCLNKYELMKFLKVNRLSVIESFLGSEFKGQFSFPIFVKPVSGRGSRGIRKIYTQEQLKAYYILEGFPPEEVLVQPLVEGMEYTVGVTTNNLNKILCISSKRIVSKRGITQVAVTENNSQINKLTQRLIEIMQPKGPINIQLFLTEEGEIKIFEINPRFSTTTILEIEAGVNVVKEYIDTIDNEDVGPIKFPEPGLTIHRRWESVFYRE